MKTLASNIQCGCRLGLGMFLFTEAAATLLSPNLAANAHAGFSQDPSFISIVLHGLLLTISIWLVFGVRTRVVALLGAMLYLAYALYSKSVALVPDDVSVQVLLVAILAAPLVAFGGGQYSLYKKGWQNIL
jgi:uncharacterized membrane protein YphA (DoxX/SURF4 family)